MPKLTININTDTPIRVAREMYSLLNQLADELSEETDFDVSIDERPVWFSYGDHPEEDEAKRIIVRVN